MPTLEEIRTITIKSKTDGVDQSADSVNKLADAQNKLNVESDKSSKSTLSAQNALDRQQRSLDASWRSSQSYTKAISDLDRAHAQGLTSIERHNELIHLAAEKYGQGNVTAMAFHETLARVRGQVVGLAEAAGPVGEFLTAIGPWGVAAAVGLGLAAEAAHLMVEEAERMGQFARQLRENSETIGVNTDQLQALNIAAEHVGVTAEQSMMSLQRFTVGLNQLREGHGTLFTELQKTAPALTRELAATRDVTNAIDIMAKAYATATDQVQRNAIARAAFGRQGFAEGRVLTAIDQAGGLAAYQHHLNETDKITKDQVDHWAQMSIEIEHATTLAKNNVAAIFTGPVLEAMHYFSEGFLTISRAAKDFSLSPAGNLFFTALLNVPKAIALGPAGIVSSLMGAGASQGHPAGGHETADSFGDRFGAGSSAPTLKTEFLANEMKGWTSAMGSAVTVQEQLKLKLLELDAAYDKNTLGIKGTAEAEDRLTRARSMINLESQIAIEGRRLSELGELAPVLELNRQKEDALQKLLKDRINFSPAELAAIRQRNQLLTESANIENKMIFERQQIFKSQTDQGIDQTLRAAGIPSTSDRAAAIRDYTRMSDIIKQTNDAAGTFASGFLTDLSHGVTAVDALRNAMTRLADTLIDMAARQLVRNALGNLAGSFGLGNVPMSVVPGATGVLGANGPFITPTFHSGGILGLDGGAGRYIHPSYFDDAKRFAGGGIMGLGPDEIPIIGHRNEEVIRRDDPRHRWNGSGGGTVVNVNVENHTESNVSVQQTPNSSGGTDLRVMVRKLVSAGIAGGDYDAANQARYGIKTQPRGR